MEDIVNIIVNNGVAVGVVLYFIWKDAKLTKENTDILNQIKAMLIILSGKEEENHEIKQGRNEEKN